MDAGIIVSSLIEKIPNETTTTQTMIGKQLQLLKEFFIKDAKDNQLFVHGHSTSEQKMTSLLQVVYTVEDYNSMTERKSKNT